MTVSVKIYPGQKLTQKQIEEIKMAAEKTPVYDEDAPELSLEQLNRYRQAAIRKKETSAITVDLTLQKHQGAVRFPAGITR